MAADSYCVTSKYVPEFLHMVIYQMCSTAAFIHLNCNYVFICHSTGQCISKMQECKKKKKTTGPQIPWKKMEDMACVSSIGAAACWTIPQLDITLNQFTSICGWPASACWLAQLLTRDRKWLPPSPLSGVTGCEDHGEVLHYFFACVCVCFIFLSPSGSPFPFSAAVSSVRRRHALKARSPVVSTAHDCSGGGLRSGV